MDHQQEMTPQAQPRGARGRGRTAIGRRVLERVAAGATLAEVAADPDLASIEQVLGWLIDPRAVAFRDGWMKAAALRAELWMEQAVALADACAAGAPTADLNKVKLQIEVRRWACERVAPRRELAAVLGGAAEAGGSAAPRGADPVDPELLAMVVARAQAFLASGVGLVTSRGAGAVTPGSESQALTPGSESQALTPGSGARVAIAEAGR